jgi:Tfp pilus assembly protein PilF
MKREAMMDKTLRIAMAVWMLAMVLWATGTGAEELFDLNASQTHFQNGLQFYFQNQYPAAVHEFQEALSINPDDARSYYFLGYAFYRLGEMEKAREAFDQAYQLNPQYSPIPKGIAQN